uniref:Pectinesterase inhibitor n=1 Tax=Cajanus cajan TaxID=3821 RepID=A0A151SCV6_CAJCA|nr:Pectinesterase inhibitor [Cajanus cajan]
MILIRSSNIVLLYLAILLALFVPPSQSILSHTSLLEQICRQSPHYHLCVITLRSSIHHRSKEDIVGFARLTLEIVNANATITLEHIDKICMQAGNPKLKKALKNCNVSYNMIVKVHLQEALNAMNKGDYKDVQQKAYVAILEAESCNNKFKNLPTSPLRDTNRYVQNLCSITMSIVDKLVQPYQPTSI